MHYENAHKKLTMTDSVLCWVFLMSSLSSPGRLSLISIASLIFLHQKLSTNIKAPVHSNADERTVMVPKAALSTKYSER